MNFKKRLNGSWVDTSCYIHKTATDTFANLPATLYPTGVTSTVELKGNTVQSGTPTPDNPIMPQSTGERTGNLFDSSTIEVGGLSPTTGAEITDDTRLRSGFISVEPSTNYGLSREITSRGSFFWVIAYDENKNIVTDATVSAQFSGVLVAGRSLTINRWTFTTTPTTKYIRWYVTADNSYKNIMLNTGSTPLPYEPYGYKIPISSANTTTPVYLGEAETTRKIKKLVLTGNEPWQNTYGVHLFVFQFYGAPFIDKEPALCTEYMYNPVQSGINIGTKHGEFVLQKVAVGTTYFYSIGLKNENYSTVEDFKLYLQQQYVAGTPVTVWYVLATEETAIVNEPLVKIGDYADTLSNISIPVTAGGDTISVDTTVQPSGVAINYKGWHNAKCKEYSYNMTIADWESASISQMENHTIQESQGGNWV